MLKIVRCLGPLAAVAALGSCRAGLSDEGRLRTVVLQYAQAPTSADSTAASGISGTPATMYPLVNAIAVQTALPVSAFATMQPEPFPYDMTTAGRNCAALSVLLYVDGTPTSADSAFVVNVGFEDAFLLHGPPPSIAADFQAEELPAINRLNSDSRFISGHLLLESCPTFEAQGRHTPGTP